MPQTAQGTRARSHNRRNASKGRLPVAGEVLIRWADRAKNEHREAIGDVDGTTFHENWPIRKFGIYRDMTNFPGKYWAATIGLHVGFQSWAEREWALVLDFDPSVTGIASQPFQVMGREGKDLWRHVPDYFAARRGRPPLVLDVRPEERVDDQLRLAVQRTAAVCATLGWEYRLVHKVDPQLLWNIGFLSAYRRPFPDPLNLRPEILQAAASPATVGEICDQVGVRELVMPHLFRLCWLHRIRWDLRSQLRFYTTKLIASAAERALRDAA